MYQSVVDKCTSRLGVSLKKLTITKELEAKTRQLQAKYSEVNSRQDKTRQRYLRQHPLLRIGFENRSKVYPRHCI